ncbi:MAG TPA: hypothetical protein PKJ42_00930 [Candidatus Goldiibacteriota bacterium]|nr:hypothetical protein [Candidatus Goldiibacteriota bacterium]
MDDIMQAQYEQKNAVLIPGFGRHGIIFNKDNLVYKEKTYYYSNLTSIYYRSEKMTVNFIPVLYSFYAGLRFGKEKIDIIFTAPFYIGAKKKEAVFFKLVTLLGEYVMPLLISNILRDIFENGKSAAIGNITFTKDGYSKKKLFGGTDSVMWAEQVYLPVPHEGYIYVYKDKNGKAKVFKTLRMSTTNAVLLPELVQQAYNRFHNIGG